jgi:hypothetical protein
MRGFGTSAEFRRNYPDRFDKLARAMQKALQNDDLIAILHTSSIGGRWTGPEESGRLMRESFSVFRNYSYLLRE